MTEKQKILQYIRYKNCDIIDIETLDSTNLTLSHGGVIFNIITPTNFNFFKNQLDFNTHAIFILQNQEQFDIFISRIPDFNKDLNDYYVIPIEVISPVIQKERKISIEGSYPSVMIRKDRLNRCWKIQ